MTEVVSPSLQQTLVRGNKRRYDDESMEITSPLRFNNQLLNNNDNNDNVNTATQEHNNNVQNGFQFKRVRLGIGSHDANTHLSSSTGINSNVAFQFNTINNNNDDVQPNNGTSSPSNEENTLNEHRNKKNRTNSDHNNTEEGFSNHDLIINNDNNHNNNAILREWKRSRGVGYRQVSSPSNMKDGGVSFLSTNTSSICVNQSQSITRLTQDLQQTKRALTAQVAANLRLSEALHKEKEEKKILSRGVMDQNHKVVNLQREKESLQRQVDNASGVVQGYEQVLARAAEHIAGLEATIRQLKGEEEDVVGMEPYHFGDNNDFQGPPSVH